MFRQPTSTVGDGEIRNMIEEIQGEVNSLKILAALSQENEDHSIVSKSLFDKVDTLLTLVSKEVETDGVKFFTIYWKSGDRKVIAGESFEEAFHRSGFDASSLTIISFIHEGVTNWKFDKRKKVWMESK